MALFEKSLQAVKTLDTVLTTAQETFRTEQKSALETLRNPSEKIAAMREVLNSTEAEQKSAFREKIEAEFAAVFAMVEKVVTAAPPADFPATLEAIRASAQDLTQREAETFLEKFRGNYLAFRTLHSVFKEANIPVNPSEVLILPDVIEAEMNEGKAMLLNWARNWKGASYTGELLKSDRNPITALEKSVQAFIDGRFTITTTEENEALQR